MHTKKNGFHSQYLVNTMKRNFLIKMIYNFFLPSLLMNFTFFTPLFPYTPLIPEIWLLILPLKITYKNLVLDHDDNFYLISLSILSTCLLNSVWILPGRSQLFITYGNWKIKFMCEKYLHSLNSPACVFDKPRVCQSIITDFTTEAIRMPVSLHSFNNTPNHKFTYKGNLNVRVFSNWVLKNFTPSPLQCES